MNKKGFTLVELISVVVLLSIILILVIPAYTQIEGQIKNSNLKNKKSMISNAMLEYANTNLLDKLKPLGQTGTNELYYSLDYIIENNIFAASETDSQGNKMFLNPVTNDKLYGCIKVTYDVNKFEVKTEFIDKNNQAEMDNCKG